MQRSSGSKQKSNSSKRSFHKTHIPMTTLHIPSGQTQWCSDCDHGEEAGNISPDPANQGLNRIQSGQPGLSSYYGPEAGGAGLGSKSISLCCCYFSFSAFLFSSWKRNDGRLLLFINISEISTVCIGFVFFCRGLNLNLNVTVGVDVLFFLRCSNSFPSRFTFNFPFLYLHNLLWKDCTRECMTLSYNVLGFFVPGACE